MEHFINLDFNIKKIALAYYVPTTEIGSPIHKNRPNHGLVFRDLGSSTYIFKNGKEYENKTNSILYLPQGADYTVKSNKPCSCYAINFTVEDDLFAEPFVFQAKNSAKFLELFKTSENYWKTQKNGYQLKCKALFYEILYQLQKEYNTAYTDNKKRETISPAVAYIHKHYTDEILNVSELAEMCKITPEYFRKIFAQIHGTSPVKYISNLRLNRAKELLSSGMYTVTDAAYGSGFNDLSYFSREFKKDTGISPLEFKSSKKL